MNRRLLVMRHAKSSWGEAGLPDHARPLNKRGRRDAPRIAARLNELGWVPERVISSDAQRTRETYGLLEPVLEPTPEVRFTNDLYLASVPEVRAAVGALSDEVHTAMVLGHNDGWQDVVAWLCGSYETLTTANVALLSIEAPTWEAALQAAPGWTLHQVLRPKELDD